MSFASASTHQRSLPVRNVSIFGYLQCSQQNTNSLPTFHDGVPLSLSTYTLLAQKHPVGWSNVALFASQAAQRKANPLPSLTPHVRISPMFSTKCDFTTFASRTLYFHPLTDSFRKNRGVGYARPNNQMTSLFIPLQKGKKPRIAWGEAIRGLGDNYEDWAVRSSLRLSVARPL